jgi:hypothetical protein
MIELLAVLFGIFFVFLDVSFLPLLAKGNMFFDFTLFYLATLIITPIKDKIFYILLIIMLFKSIFLLNEEIFIFFSIYFFSIILLFSLINILSTSNKILEIIICSIFLIVEIIFTEDHGFSKILYSILISAFVWSFLNPFIKYLFNKIYGNIMRGKIQITGEKY